MDNSVDNPVDKSIRIECQGAETANYKDLINLQGSLKSLSEEAYQRFRRNLIQNGFSEPINIWNDGGVYRILNGHQRLATIKRMVEEEGFEIGPIPISFVFAKNLQEAKEKILALTSEYGQVTREGLDAFLADVDISREYLTEAIQIKGFDIQGYLDQMQLNPQAAVETEVTHDLEPSDEPGGNEILAQEIEKSEAEKEIAIEANEEIPEVIQHRTKVGDVFQIGMHRLLNGDCLARLATLPSDAVHALVTDPPAGISFMGKEWDEDKGGSKQWIAWMESVMRECMRVMKPGAHGLVWAIPRTSHWTVPR